MFLRIAFQIGMGGGNFRQCHQRSANGRHPRECIYRHVKAGCADQVAGQRQVGDAEGLGVAASGAFRQQRLAGTQPFAKPVRSPFRTSRLVRTKALGKLRTHSRYHQRVGVGSRQ